LLGRQFARSGNSAQRGGLGGCQPGVGVGHHLTVGDRDGLEEPLLTQGEGDEVPELDQLGLGEVLMQPVPQVIGGERRVPGDGERPFQRGPLTIIEAVGILEVVRRRPSSQCTGHRAAEKPGHAARATIATSNRWRHASPSSAPHRGRCRWLASSDSGVVCDLCLKQEAAAQRR